MGLSIIVIFFYHLQFSVDVYKPFWYCGQFGVDVFLFVSGFGCVYALRKYSGLINFLVKRFNRIVPTALFVGVCIYYTDFYFRVDFANARFWEKMLMLHHWYIPMILLSYLLCPLFYKVLGKYNFLGLICLSGISIALGLVAPTIRIYLFPWYLHRMAAFLVGMFIAMNDFVIGRKYKYLAALCFFFAFILSGRIYPENIDLRKEMWTWATLLAISLPWVCVSVARLGESLKHTKLYNWINIVGESSLEIYLIHEYVIFVLEIYNPNPIIYTVLSIIITFILVVGVKTIMRYVNAPIVYIQNYFLRMKV